MKSWVLLFALIFIFSACDDDNNDDGETVFIQENCANATDDDGDGLIDCSDPDCESYSVCQTVPIVCGDGMITGNEPCDGTELGVNTCESLGYHGGKLFCGNDCTYDTFSCESFGRCGDSNIQTMYGEECEGGNLNGQTCNALGYYGGQLFCEVDCKFDLSDCENVGICGDGIFQSDLGEKCEGTELGGTTCLDYGHLYGGGLLCDNSCEFDTAECNRFEQITAGDFHTCAISNTQQAYCWGENTAGQLGTADDTSQLTPHLVSGNYLFNKISAGYAHTCGITTANVLYCWGKNNNGQLGDGTTSPKNIPTVVSGGYSFIDVSAGVNHTCGVTLSGQAYCWGNGSMGQLGNNSIEPKYVPSMVDGEISFASIVSAGEHTCGLDTSGQLYCWGYAIVAEGTYFSVPYAVPSGDSFMQISAGESHVCGVKQNGDVYCRGFNSHGEIGDGTTHNRYTPTKVVSDETYSSVFLGKYHSCAVNTVGEVYCWGDNSDGQLGNGENPVPINSLPIQVSSSNIFTTIAGGAVHTCGITEKGNGYCWGNNTDGVFGDDSNTSIYVPTPISSW
jgi:alpha-tubulin suppressor-like RCC1 family protein